MDLLLVIVTLLLTLLQESSACSCMPAHLQHHYCKSDFIIVATVKQMKDIHRRNDLPQSTELEHPDFFASRIPMERRFTVRVHRTYKGMENKHFRNALKKYIYTAGSGAGCGVMLETQTTYILSGNVRGGKLTINMCNWIQEHKSLQAHQKKFLKFMYRKHCGCAVTTCLGGYCPSVSEHTNPKKMCKYSPNWSNDCYQKHGLCVGTGGVCHWKKNNKFKLCLKNNGESYPWKLMRKRVEEKYELPRRRGNDPNVIGFPGFVEP